MIAEVKKCGVDAQQQRAALKAKHDNLDKLGVDIKLKPQNLFKSFNKVQDKECLQQILANRARWTQLQPIQGGTKPFLSSIKAWACFAINVFCYGLSIVLPPLAASHGVLRVLFCEPKHGAELRHTCTQRMQDLSCVDGVGHRGGETGVQRSPQTSLARMWRPPAHTISHEHDLGQRGGTIPMEQP